MAKDLHPRLINQLFENPKFKVDHASIPYIVRDIINMNWWNTCDFVWGYENNRRVFNPHGPSKAQKAVAITLKEYYRERNALSKNADALKSELKNYVRGRRHNLTQLNYHSEIFRRNNSQYYHRPDGTPTWLDCTSRAKYAFSYLGAKGYLDFDGACRVIDGSKITNLVEQGICHDIGARIVEGENQCKKEIFSQKHNQRTVKDWVELLGIKILVNRKWLYDEIKHVRTDPYKTFEAAQISKGEAKGVNEGLYGLNVSSASRASDASHASRASNASDASDASAASNASAASDAGPPPFKPKSKNWFDEPKAFGPVPGLIHPPEFRANKFGLAGNWKINEHLVRTAQLGWFDPFMGWGKSPLLAARLGVKYFGQDTNRPALDGYLIPYVLPVVKDRNATFRYFDSTQFDPDLVGKFDVCYTSPPYFDFEEYSEENLKQVRACKTYEGFHEKVTRPVFSHVRKYLVPGGILALQVEKSQKRKDQWREVILSLGYRLMNETTQGGKSAYSKFAKRDQNLLVFENVLSSEEIKKPGRRRNIMKEIKVTCTGAAKLPIDKILDFQGGLKTMTEDALSLLKGQMIKYGFNSPVQVWKKGQQSFTLDGHQRCAALKSLKEDGYQIPKDVPVDWIEAKNKKEAKEILLSRVAQYGKVQSEGLHTFIDESGIQFEKVKNDFPLPDFNMERFEKEYFADPDDAEEEQAKLDEKHKIFIKCPSCGETFERGKAKEITS